MKKLTKQQRLEAYVYCWFRLQMVGDQHACFILDDWLFVRKRIITDTCSDTQNLFPELKSLRPNDPFIGGSWFKTPSERLRAIEICIRLCEQSQD